MTTEPAGRESFLLSQLVRRPLLHHGRRVGSLLDLSVLVGPSHPPVHRVLVRLVGSSMSSLLPAETVRLTGDLTAEVTGEPLPATDELEERELLLARDVLDTQVVDLEGHRLVRVSDVVVVRAANGRLEVAAVDVSLRSFLARVVPSGARRHPVTSAVDWEDVHLTSARGHSVQLGLSTAGFRRLDDRGLAELVSRLAPRHAGEVMGAVEPDRATAALGRSHPVVVRRLLELLHPPPAKRAAVRPHRAVRRRLRRTAGWRRHPPPDRQDPS